MGLNMKNERNTFNEYSAGRILEALPCHIAEMVGQYAEEMQMTDAQVLEFIISNFFNPSTSGFDDPRLARSPAEIAKENEALKLKLQNLGQPFNET